MTSVVSRGDGDWRVEVSILRNLASGNRGSSDLLCVLERANYNFFQTDRAVPIMTFHTSLNGVVDAEHDVSKLALVEVALPHTTYDSDGYRTVVGILTSYLLYPDGIDPLEQSDQDTKAGWCRDEGEPHRFAPYLPPERPETQALIGRPVKVELSLWKDES